MKFLRAFGLGLLYVVIFPLIVAGVALVMVFGFFYLIVGGIVALIRFFSGGETFPPFEEDVEAQRRKEAAALKDNEAPAPATTQNNTSNTSNVYVQQNYYGHPSANPNPELQQNPNYFNDPNQMINQQNPYPSMGPAHNYQPNSQLGMGQYGPDYDPSKDPDNAYPAIEAKSEGSDDE